MMRQLMVVVSALLVVLLLTPERAAAEGGWLDGPATDWNTASMPIPQAPPRDPAVDPRCFDALVVPDTAGKRALVAAGWFLFNSPPGATQGVEIVSGQSSADGMCRPTGYQTFVFVDGSFAGTLSPVLMHSRDDGALVRTSVLSSSQIQTEYVRYTDRDPLCCPSAKSTATFEIARVGGVPVVRRGSVTTVPTGAPTPVSTPPPQPSASPVPPPIQAPAQLPRGQ